MGLDAATVAPKFLSQFFESASLEEDETLQDMWANLLLNKSLNPKTNGHYITILKDLEPLEAKLLDELFRQSNMSTGTQYEFSLIMKSSNNSMSVEELSVLIQKMYGFNILRPPLLEGISIGPYSPAVETVDQFRFSEMGLDFCKKCTTLKPNS
jgi:hypothetical protein